MEIMGVVIQSDRLTKVGLVADEYFPHSILAVIVITTWFQVVEAGVGGGGM